MKIPDFVWRFLYRHGGLEKMLEIFRADIDTWPGCQENDPLWTFAQTLKWRAREIVGNIRWYEKEKSDAKSRKFS